MTLQRLMMTITILMSLVSIGAAIMTEVYVRRTEETCRRIEDLRIRRGEK